MRYFQWIAMESGLWARYQREQREEFCQQDFTECDVRYMAWLEQQPEESEGDWLHRLYSEDFHPGE